MRQETAGEHRIRLNEEAIKELVPLSDLPDVVATAFTLYTQIPGKMLRGLSLGNPESFVRFVEKNPEKARKIISDAKAKGIFN